jgi:hypothetical protein
MSNVKSLFALRHLHLHQQLLGIQSTVYSLQSTVYSLQSAVYSLQSTVYSLQSTVYSTYTYCTTYSLQYLQSTQQTILQNILEIGVGRVLCGVVEAPRTRVPLLSHVFSLLSLLPLLSLCSPRSLCSLSVFSLCCHPA